MSVIAAGDITTAETGAAILRRGGNAVDAAVAAAFVSFISEIGIVHLGGSGVAQIFIPGNRNSTTYDFFSSMPGLGNNGIRSDLDFQKVTVDFGPARQDFFLGRGSVAVPGNIAGLCQMAADCARFPLHVLLEPAIRLARDGHALAPFQAKTCALLELLYTNTTGISKIFAKNGRIIQSGERLFVPDLAGTLEKLAQIGPELARTGELARIFVEDQGKYGGLITHEDLCNYEVYQRPAISMPYRGYEVLLPPPSSSGGVLTAFTLKLLGQFEVSQIKPGSAGHLQLLYEIMAASTRARPIWDKYVETLEAHDAVDRFLSDSMVARYTSEIKEALELGQSSPSFSEPSHHHDTSHLSVIDKDGMAVSLTTTAGESAGYVVPGTGFIPNNILGEADLHPAGFHTRPAGSRISTMMTPVVVLQEGAVRLVLGSGGSIRIRSAILQVLSNLLDFKMPLAEAVYSPRVHLEDGCLQCELGFDTNAVDWLESKGYPVNRWDRRSIYFGGAHSVSRTPEGKMVAAGDERRGGATATAYE